MHYVPTFLSMAVAHFLCLTNFGVFVLFPLFITAHGGNQVDIGIIMGAFALSCVLCRPWISEMIDRIGRKKSYAAGSLLMTLMSLSYLLFRGALDSFYLALILVRVIHGIGFAICVTAAFTYIADIIPQEHLGRGLGVFGISGLLGGAIGPVIGELVIRDAGFEVLFVVASVMSCFCLIMQFRLKETYVHVTNSTKSSFFLVLQKKRIFTVAVISLLFGFGLAAVNGFVSSYASERRITFISLYFIAYSVAAILTRLFNADILDRAGENRIIPCGLALLGGGLLLLVFTRGNGLLFLSGLITGWGHGWLYPALNSSALKGELQATRGKITGVFTGSIDTGSFVGSIVLGYVGELAGFQTLFIVAGAVVISAIFIFRGRTVFVPARSGLMELRREETGPQPVRTRIKRI